MKRTTAILLLGWCAIWSGLAVWGSGTASNPGSPVSIQQQGPDPTGNGGYPFSVVNATGTSLDVNVTGSAVSSTVDQGNPNAGGASAWPVAHYAQDPNTLLPVALQTAANIRVAASASELVTSGLFDASEGNIHAARDVKSAISVGLDTGWDGSGTTWVAQSALNGGGFDMIRTANVFKTVPTAAVGNTALWTPAAGKKFRLMRYMVTVTDQATQAAPGTVTISLFDGAAGATGQVHDIFVPALGLVNNGSLYTSGWIDLGNGYLSTAANNVLNINLSAALTAGTVRVICCGTEE